MLLVWYEHLNTKDTKDRQLDYYMPPFRGIKPVCHDRNKMCDQMWVKIT